MDRLVNWGSKVESTNDVFWATVKESMVQLFFDCTVTQRIWQKVQNMCGVFRSKLSWDCEIAWLAHHWSKDSFCNQFKRTALTVTEYTIWRIRNEIRFHSKQRLDVAIFETIINTVHYKAVSWDIILRAKENWRMLVEWGIPTKIFDIACISRVSKIYYRKECNSDVKRICV